MSRNTFLWWPQQLKRPVRMPELPRKGRVTRRPSYGLPLRLEALEDRFLPSGTPSLLADINPGSSSSNPSFFTNVGGTVFFDAGDGVHGVELWRSDGTAAGTQLVSDINPGSAARTPTT